MIIGVGWWLWSVAILGSRARQFQSRRGYELTYEALYRYETSWLLVLYGATTVSGVAEFGNSAVVM
jgi:hypothetical protein